MKWYLLQSLMARLFEFLLVSSEFLKLLQTSAVKTVVDFWALFETDCFYEAHQSTGWKTGKKELNEKTAFVIKLIEAFLKVNKLDGKYAHFESQNFDKFKIFRNWKSSHQIH